MNVHHIHQSQTRALRAVVGQLWPLVFVDRRPADRALAEYLRSHREFGGRDRRLLGDTLFGLLRWWGWLQDDAPDPGAPDPDVDAARWCRVFLGVALLEAEPPAAIYAYWALQAGLGENDYAALLALPEPAARAAALLQRPSSAFAAARLLPDWVASELQPGCALPQLVSWIQRRPPIWLRAQVDAIPAVLAELRAAGLRPEPLAALPGAISLGHARVNLQTLPAYREGRIEVQDVTSQAVAAACGARAGERWWDVCAGAGGKTLALAHAVGEGGRVLATDIRGEAVAELQRRVRRAGVANVKGATIKAHRASGGRHFDGVLVDAPCSGSGTWRRNPWARWQLVPEALPAFVRRQVGLLDDACRAVKPGGVLVYATCSLLRAENADVITRFLAAHSEFVLAPFPHPIGGAATNGALQLWPWDADGDAMFVARLQRASR